MKETIKTKRPPTEWKKISAKDISDKGSKSKIYKEFIQFDSKRNPTTQLTNKQKT